MCPDSPVAASAAGSPLTSRRLILATLGLVLVVSAYFRFAHLAEADFVSPDEYVYFDAANDLARNLGDIVREARYPHHVLHAVLQSVKFFPAWARPTWNLIAALATLVFGLHKSTALGISAVSGVLTVAATYWLARTLFQQGGIALLAALLVAVNPGHVLFSRMGLQISSAIFFVVIAFAFYARSRADRERPGRSAALAGASLAAGVGCHPSALLLLPAFIILGIHGAAVDATAPPAQRRHIVRAATPLAILLAAFLGGCAIWEVPRVLFHVPIVLTGGEAPFGPYLASFTDHRNTSSYVSQLLATGGDQGVAHPAASFGYFPSFIIDSQGKADAAILAAALAWLVVLAARRWRDSGYAMLLCWTLAVYVLYSLPYGQSEIRVFMLVEPALCLTVALLIWHVGHTRWRRSVFAAIAFVLTAVTVGSGWVHSGEVIETQLSYAPMKTFLLAHPDIDKVMMNANTMQISPPKYVPDWMEGWAIAHHGFDNGGTHVINPNASRVGVYYRDARELLEHPVVKENGPSVHWPEDVRDLYLQGKVRYLVTSIFDYQWQLAANTPFPYRNLNDVRPVFSYGGPFASKARRYDQSQAIRDYARVLSQPYFQTVGIYDLRDVFEPGGRKH